MTRKIQNYVQILVKMKIWRMFLYAFMHVKSDEKIVGRLAGIRRFSWVFALGSGNPPI